MAKRIFGWSALILLLLLLFAVIFLPGIAERSMNKVVGTDARVSPAAAALHARLAIADLHGDSLLWQRNILDRSAQGQVDLPRLNDGHVALQVFSSVSQTPWGQNYQSNDDSDNLWLLTMFQRQPMTSWFSPLGRTLWHGAKLRGAAAASHGRLRQILTIADLDRLLADRAAGRDVTGALFSVEGLQNLEGRFDNLDTLYRAGVRMAGFTHFFDNAVAGSMHGRQKGGLTPLGRRVLREMERRGMVVDIAHCSHACVADILAMATKPVVFSHGGVQATCNENRNLNDDEIRGVARTGGVVGIGLWSAAVCGTEPADTARAMAHVRDLVGIDHVALGSDFDGAVTTGYDASRLALLTSALKDAGFSDDDIAKAMGGNVIRVLRAALPAR